MANSLTQTDFYSLDNINSYDDDARQILKDKIKKTQYSDLDLRFLSSPNTSDIVKRTGKNSVRQSVKNLILTDYYERLFLPVLGSGIKSLLFEPLDFITERRMEDMIRTTLENFEPRISIVNIDVKVNFDETGYDIKIVYVIINTDEKETFTTFLERSRG